MTEKCESFFLYQKHLKKVIEKTAVTLASSLKFWTLQKQSLQLIVTSQNAFKYKFTFILHWHWMQ